MIFLNTPQTVAYVILFFIVGDIHETNFCWANTSFSHPYYRQ